MLKKILIGLVVLVVLVIAAAFALPFFLPVDTIKQELQAQVKQATGRDLVIDGDFEVSLLPEAVLKAGDVRFQNAAGGSRADMMTLKELRVHVALLPLLSREVEVQEFVLDKPDILLEVDKNGRPNWAFGSAGKTGDAGVAAKPSSAGGTNEALQALRLGDVRIVDGRLEYRDARSGAAETVDKLNVTLALPGLDDPFSADGSATWHQQALSLTLGVQKPRALMQGNATDVTVKVSGEPLTLAYGGTLDAGKGSAAGQLDLSVPSVRGLAEWVGSPLQIQGDKVLNALKLSGKVAASPGQAAISGLTLSLDDINATGDLTAKLGANVPTVQGKLAVDALNLNPYLEAFGSTDAPGAGGKAAAPSAASNQWSDEPIDFSALRAVNADLMLAVGSLQAKDIKIGKSQVHAVLQGGKLDLNLSEMALYDGNGKLQLNVDASGKTPTVKSTFSLASLQAEPFLTDAAKLDWLSGTAAMEMSVTTRGNSQKALANALNGSGKMTFLDGAVRGTNLAALLRGLSTLKLDPSSWETSKTDFAELSGTFTIKDGVLTNKDLALLSQLLRVSGQGTVGIGARNIDYTAQPKAVASLQGQGGAADVGGLPVSVHVHGGWNDPQTDYSLGQGDLTELAKDPKALVSSLSNLGAIKDPKALADQLGGSAGGGVLDALKSLGGTASPTGTTGTTGGATGTGTSSPIDSLKQLVPGTSGTTEGTTTGTDSGTPTTEPSSPTDSLKKLFGR
ncbi:MAG: AsmA family protein [Alphaproteobacteria bacterium]|nr:AsmA family protein [Alphaproteobacteria bacterium]MCB9928154.1 AsmA family protein [Alphaproteobacteria bacterium]